MYSREDEGSMYVRVLHVVDYGVNKNSEESFKLPKFRKCIFSFPGYDDRFQRLFSHIKEEFSPLKKQRKTEK